MEVVTEKERLRKYQLEIGSPSREDLVALNAMYHPEALEKIPHYIARKQGKELCELICRLTVSPRIDEFHRKFVEQGMKNEYDEQILERIWLFLERNALYIS